ncbi:hypothetical protein K439DRAFT_283773 [Ramaria rubella]|nr:hypothetical protein K439DRAFT_283773 [Ramaria rubella]
MRIKGAMGLDMLLISDPKTNGGITFAAGMHIPTYLGERQLEAREPGAQHVRNRKTRVLEHCKVLEAFLPIFRYTTQKGILYMNGKGSLALRWMAQAKLHSVMTLGHSTRTAMSSQECIEIS